MPREVVEDRFGGLTWELAIYRNEDLDSMNGTAAEETIVNHVSPSLTDLGVNHRILFDFDPVPLDDRNSGCSTQALENWTSYGEEGNLPVVAKDCNLYLNPGGGGCAFVKGRYASAGAPDIEQVRPRSLIGDKPWSGNVYVAMHEISHNMGTTPGNRSLPSDDPNSGVVQFGDTWVTNGIWQKTPSITRRDATSNACGQPITPDPGPNERDHIYTYFNDCVADQMLIREPPETGHVRIVGLSLTPNPVEVGERVTIEATMENTTDSRATRDEPVLVGDDRIDTLHFDVPSGSTQTLSTHHTPSAPGDYIVQVNQGVDTLTVEEETIPPGDLRIAGVSVSPTPPEKGDQSVITVTGRNYGDGPVNQMVDVLVNGSSIGAVDFEIDGAGLNREYREQERSIYWTPQSAGDFQISAGDSTSTVTVVDPNGGGNGGQNGGETGTGVSVATVALAAGGLALLISRPSREEVESWLGGDD